MMARFNRCAAMALCVAAAGFGAPLFAIDLDGVQPAAIDQPQINALLYISDINHPQVGTVDTFDWDTFASTTGQVFNITAYFDTGASSILLSTGTAGSLNVPVGTSIYSDTGVAGSDLFGVSQNIKLAITDYYYNRTDLDQFNAGQPVTTPYHPVLNPGNNDFIRVQLGPIPHQVQDPTIGDTGQLIDQLKQLLGTDNLGSPFDEIEQLIAQLNAVDVIGMPAMLGKVVVIDPTRVKNLTSFLNNIDTINDVPDMFLHTYVYNPGTAFNPLAKDTNPGIPTTSHHVKLSYGDFGRFTVVTPAGGDAPTLAHNPFIGKDPVRKLFSDPLHPQEDVPGIKITRGTGATALFSEGNWLLDTGAAASMISLDQAKALNVFYKDGTFGSATAELVDENGNTIDGQFQLTIGGVGGNITVAGFFLDSLLLRTQEGSATDDNNPNNIRFTHAPVLVNDISLIDPATGKKLTLDGIFGMNFLVGSTPLDQSDPSDPLAGLAPVPGFFDWITFDEPNGVLGLNLDPSAAAVPEPTTALLLIPSIAALALRRRQAR